MSDIARGFVPSLPDHHHVRYAFLAVSILGATVSPYLVNFYSSGTIEEKLSEKELWVNTITAYAGTFFGTVVAMGVLVTSAIVLEPRQIQVDSYDQAALMFVPAFGRWAIGLFAAALGIGCFGAAVEITINAGYLFAQVFGWSWGANKPRRDAARFTAGFTIVLLGAFMPAIVLPFLVLMNDEKYVKTHTSTAWGNGLLAALTILGALMALVVIPLEILGG
jgi:Mn2+/Fe2+ NRAMP family transporter